MRSALASCGHSSPIRLASETRYSIVIGPKIKIKSACFQMIRVVIGSAITKEAIVTRLFSGLQPPKHQ